MKLIVEKGDLFELDDDKYTFTHCISLDSAMARGIAVEFVKKYPRMREMLQGTIRKQHINYPTAIAYCDNEDTTKVNVINLITKANYWHKPTYETLEQALIKAKSLCIQHDIKYLAMPKIGCGLDRLEWHRVEQMIVNIFRDLNIEIVICYL